MTEVLIKLGGIYTLAFAAFQLLFWWIFNWKRELRLLSALNRAILQVLNLCLTFVFFMFVYISLAHAAELLSTPLGHSLVTLIAIFWFARALEQVVFFRLRQWGSWHFSLSSSQAPPCTRTPRCTLPNKLPRISTHNPPAIGERVVAI